MKVFEFDPQRFAFDIDYDKLILSGTNEAESLNNPLIGAKIFAYGGNDTIYNYYEKASINGGTGADYIENHAADVSISGDGFMTTALYGNDTIVNDGDNVTIDTGLGNDSIVNGSWNGTYNFGGNNVTINGMDGNNDITNSGGEYVLIRVGDGDNKIHNGGWNNSTNSNAGSHHVTVSAGSGNNDIYSRGDFVSVQTGNGNNSITNHGGNNVTVNTGDGNDTINSSGEKFLTFAGDGNDIITHNEGYNPSIYAGAGDDEINNNGGQSGIIDAGAGNDNIYNYGASVSIDGGTGDDTIRLYLTYEDPDTSSYVTVNGGDGNDSIDNHGHHALIDGGNGNDTLTNYVGMVDGIPADYEANYSTLRGGDGDDFIDNHGHHVLIEGGNGNDVLWNNQGAGVDGEADYSTLSGGAGDDTIRNYGQDLLIDAGDGNDDIWNGGRNVTIASGAGDDFIENNEGHGTAYVYTSGNDTIHGFKSYDTFVLGDVSIDSFEQTDGQLKINLSNGNHILLTEYWGFGEAIHTVSSLEQVQRVEFTENHESNQNISVADDNNYIFNDGDNTTITTGNGNNCIRNGDPYLWATASGGHNVKIKTGSGNDFIRNNHGTNVSIDSGDGADIIYIAVASSVTVNAGGGNDYGFIDSLSNGLINGGDGNDFFAVNGNNNTLNGGAGNDTLRSGGDNVTIDGGSGNDYLDNKGGDNVSISGGEGNDTIWNSGGDNVSINAGTGDDSILNFGDNVSINAGTGDDSILNFGENVSINAGTGDDIIYSNNSTNITVDGGAGNDSIYNDGGAGNDSIYNDGGANVLFVYSGGNDLICGLNATSTLKIASGELDKNVEWNGSNLVLTVGENKITLENSPQLDSLNIVDALGNPIEGFSVKINFNDTITGTNDDNIIQNTESGVLIDAGAGDDDIQNSGANVSINAGADNDKIHNYADNVSIDGGDGNDYIYNRSSYVIIDGGKGNDSIINNGRWDDGGGIIDGGEGDDYIQSRGNGVDINGGAGNDTIRSGGQYNTIDGGAGNDTIYLNSGRQVVNFSTGNGNDTIQGYLSSSTIQIDSGTIQNHSFSGQDVILSFGTDSLTLRGVKGTKLNFVDANGNAFDTVFGSADTLINGTSGADDLVNNAGNVQINLLDGNDSLSNYGDNVSIDGGNGNNSIMNSGSEVIISAGTGNDTITGGGENVLFKYNGGNDIIEGLNESSTLQIMSGEIKMPVVIKGADAILTVGGNKITLTDVEYSESGILNIVDASGNAVTPSGFLIEVADDDNEIDNNHSNATINGNDGDNWICNNGGISESGNIIGGTNVLINAGAGDDYVSNSGSNVTINGGNGNDRIWNFGTLDESGNIIGGTNVIINAGNGKDAIENHGEKVTINTGAGNDAIYNGGRYEEEGEFYVDESGESGYVSGSNVTINAGTGNDSIFNAGDNVLFVYKAGDGKDTIVGFNATSTLSISGAEYTSVKSGADLIVNVGEDAITLASAASLSAEDIHIVYTTDTTVPNKFITLTEDADNYSNTVDGATIQALGGNDTIYNDGASVSIDAGDDDDYISNFGGELPPSLDEDRTNNGDFVTISGGDGNDTIINNDGDYVSIDGGDGDDSINGLVEVDGATISGGKGSDTITGSYLGSNLSGGNDGDKFVVGGDFLTIDGGDGDDSITYNSSGTASINGGDGNDLISLGSYYSGSMTIQGGTGDDTVHNNLNDECIKASTLFKYTAGDGNDLITGFKDNDTLQIGDGTGTYSVETSGDDIIVKVGNGSVTLVDAAALATVNIAGKKVTVDGWEYSNSKATYKIDGEVVLTVDGVKSEKGLKLKGTVVTVSEASIGEEDITISGDGYTLALGTDVTTPQPTGGRWKLNDSTATYETGGKTEGYELSDDATTISFVDASDGDTLVTVDGVKSLDGLNLNGNVVTVSKASIGEEDITISGDGYTLALGKDVTTPQPTGGRWKLNDSTATYETGGTTEGYELSDDATTISFVEASESDTFVTVDGMKSVKGLSLSGETIKINPAYINSSTKGASVSGADYTFELTGSGKLFAGENTVLKGSTKNDTLVADVTTTLDGGKGNDVYIYDGDNVTVKYSASGTNGTDKVSLGAGFGIVGISADDDDKEITLTLSKKDSLGEELDGDYSLILSGANSNTKVNLVTTQYVYDKKGKLGTKATSSALYFDDGMICDSNVVSKVKKVTVFDGTDFSELAENGKNAKYKALTTITAAAENVEVIGTEKNNTIVLQSGGTAQGGLGNDTFIVESGDATIEDYGIGAKNTVSDSEVLVAKLATSVTAKETVTKKATTIFSDGEKDTIAKGEAIASYGYENEIGKYAEGADVVKVGASIQSISFDGLEGNKGDAVTDLDGQSFSVTITYGDGETVTLNNIMREVSQTKGSKNTDTAVGFKNNASVDAQALKIEYYNSTTGKYVKVGKKDLLNAFKGIGKYAAEEPSDDTANYLMSDDNFTGNELSNLVTNDTTSNGITTDNFELFGDDGLVFDSTTTTFTGSTKK